MTHDYITPLFWQHGEAEEVLREEIQRMKSVGIQSFVAEPRPHPDYLPCSGSSGVLQILSAHA